MGDRWSDEKLDQFHREFKVKAEDDERMLAEIRQRSRENMDAIERIEKNTKGLLDLWKEGNAVVKFGVAVGKFAKWLSALAFFGVLFKWLIDHNH